MMEEETPRKMWKTEKQKGTGKYMEIGRDEVMKYGRVIIPGTVGQV